MTKVTLNEMAAQIKTAARELSPTDRDRSVDALWAALSTLWAALSTPVGGLDRQSPKS